MLPKLPTKKTQVFISASEKKLMKSTSFLAIRIQVAGLLPIKKEVIERPVNMTLGVKVVDTAMEVKNTNVAPS